MAKKVVATLKSKEKSVQMTKVIRAVKTEKGSYSFLEEIIPSETLNDFLASKDK